MAVAAVSVTLVVGRPRLFLDVVRGEVPVVVSVCMAGVASLALGVDGSCATPVATAALLLGLVPVRRLPRVGFVLLFSVFEVAFWFAGSWALTSRSKVAKTTAKVTVIRSTIERGIFLPMNLLLPCTFCAQLYITIAHIDSNVWGTFTSRW